MPNFASAVQKAIKNVASIQGFGQDVTIRTITAGSYNTTTGVISESNSDATVKAVFEDVNMREVNELIQAEDKKITISAGDVTTKPTTKDKVLISSIVHNIIRVLTKTSGVPSLTIRSAVKITTDNKAFTCSSE